MRFASALFAGLRGVGRLWQAASTVRGVLKPGLVGAGYWRVHCEFYRWGSLLRGAAVKPTWVARLCHLAYAGGWKKFDRLWKAVLWAKRVSAALPALEMVLAAEDKAEKALPTRSWPTPPSALPASPPPAGRKRS